MHSSYGSGIWVAARHLRLSNIEPAMLLVVLIIGFLIIVCHQFNVVTSLIYIAPCVVSSVARTLESDSKNPTFIIHLAAMIAAVLCLGTILVSEYSELLGYK